jgi:hypothetical protein
MEYHILGSLSPPRKSMYLLSIDVLVRASFVGPPRSCSHSGGMIGAAVSGFQNAKLNQRLENSVWSAPD